MEEIKITEEVSAEEYTKYTQKIIDDNFNNTNQLLMGDQLNDLSLIKQDKHGRIKFKKPQLKKKIEFQIGDEVKNGRITGKILDIDGELVCVENQFGDIEVWNIKDVRMA